MNQSLSVQPKASTPTHSDPLALVGRHYSIRYHLQRLDPNVCMILLEAAIQRRRNGNDPVFLRFSWVSRLLKIPEHELWFLIRRNLLVAMTRPELENDTAIHAESLRSLLEYLAAERSGGDMA